MQGLFRMQEVQRWESWCGVASGIKCFLQVLSGLLSYETEARHCFCSLCMSYLTIHPRLVYVTCIPLLQKCFPQLWDKLAIQMLNKVLLMIFKRPLIVAAYLSMLCHPLIQLPSKLRLSRELLTEWMCFVCEATVSFFSLPSLSFCLPVRFGFCADLMLVFQSIWAILFVSSCKYRPLQITEYFI